MSLNLIRIGCGRSRPGIGSNTQREAFQHTLRPQQYEMVLLWALAQRSIFTGESIYPYLTVAVGISLVGVLIVAERRAVQPLLASFLYTSRAFVSSNITQFLVGVALIMALVCVPLMAATIMEKKALESALHLVRLTAAIPVGAVVGGYILRWTGVRAVCIVGLVFIGTGLLFMSGWETEVDELRLTLPLIAAGLGFGLVIPPIGVSALKRRPLVTTGEPRSHWSPHREWWGWHWGWPPCPPGVLSASTA